MLHRLIILGFIIMGFPLNAGAQELILERLCETKEEIAADPEAAAYRPGVDIGGEEVVPADLNQALNSLNYPIEVPIEIDFLRLFDIEVPTPNVGITEATPVVAVLKLYEDGRVEYNGVDISDRTTVICSDSQRWIERAKLLQMEEGRERGQEQGAPSAQQPDTQPAPASGPTGTTGTQNDQIIEGEAR